MTEEEKQDCIRTIEMLKDLAFNVHGYMDIIDSQNIDKVINFINSAK